MTPQYMIELKKRRKLVPTQMQASVRFRDHVDVIDDVDVGDSPEGKSICGVFKVCEGGKVRKGRTGLFCVSRELYLLNY